MHHRKPIYTVPKDFTATLDNALVCLRHNVVLTGTGDVVEESSNAGTPRYFPRLTFERRRQRYIPGHSTILRARFHNYYHFLVDELPRLLSLGQPPYTELSEIKLLYHGDLQETEHFILSKIGLTNVRVVSLSESPIYRTEHLIFTPFKTRLQSGYLPQRYVSLLRSKLLPDRPRKLTRLFISRERAHERTIRNRHNLMDALSDYGFRQVVLEDLSPQEQIEVLYDADVLIGAHGAGLANMLFSPAGLKVIELFPTYYVIPHYYYLSKSLGHEYAYQCGEGKHRSVQDFEVSVGDVIDSLERMGICKN